MSSKSSLGTKTGQEDEFFDFKSLMTNKKLRLKKPKALAQSIRLIDALKPKR